MHAAGSGLEAVQRSCPSQLCGQQQGKRRRGVSLANLSLGWLSSTPCLRAEATSSPSMRAEGAGWTDPVLFHTVLLSNPSWLKNKFNLTSPQQKSNSKTIMRNRQSHLRGRAVKTPKPTFPAASLTSEPLSILQGASSAFPMLSPLESVLFL